MNNQPHLNIFNPRPQQESITFPQFKLLPSELRHEIWCWGMRRNRLISLYLYRHVDENAENYRVVSYFLHPDLLTFLFDEASTDCSRNSGV